MKIKRLELSGFKSFVDRTVVNFDHEIMGIVGPNGCGKSNIVDAIRWCMGEQSAKHLRGRSMEDVIFNGSESRARADYAEVTLTFENDDPVDGRAAVIDFPLVDLVAGGACGEARIRLPFRRTPARSVRPAIMRTEIGVPVPQPVAEGTGAIARRRRIDSVAHVAGMSHRLRRGGGWKRGSGRGRQILIRTRRLLPALVVNLACIAAALRRTLRDRRLLFLRRIGSQDSGPSVPEDSPSFQQAREREAGRAAAMPSRTDLPRPGQVTQGQWVERARPTGSVSTAQDRRPHHRSAAA